MNYVYFSAKTYVGKLLIYQNINCKVAYDNACINIKQYTKMHGM